MLPRELVMPGVFGSSEDLKVARFVVAPVLVFVVDDLGRKKKAAKRTLGYYAVLVNEAREIDLPSVRVSPAIDKAVAVESYYVRPIGLRHIERL
jgi:hypothetical protein